jgi:cell fate (sporulation/competence/biofilm development) regulator YlbF (YheA/YmcA/DUF963 family)
MLASIDVAEYLHQAEDLAQKIVCSEVALHYLRCRKELQQDDTAQSLIRDFVKKKEAFEEVERFGQYHPDYHTVKQEMREKKRELDMLDTVANFKKAERALEDLLNEISKILAFSVSEEIKVPTGNPFWDQLGCGGSGCGGSCGSGCGIK